MINKPMKLDTTKWIYIGCIPQYASKEAPLDQSRCILGDCPHCQRPMWISEKKRLLQKSIGKKAVIYCLECLAMASVAQGLEPTLFDIGDRKGE
jgi:hypothetical protein